MGWPNTISTLLSYRKFGRLAIGCYLTAILPAVAQAQAMYELADVPLLPEYCKYAQDFRARVPGANNDREIARWKAALGPTYEHIHHYCYGLVATNRANLSVKTLQERRHLLGRSIGEFDYVLRNATSDFILIPEILTKKGENLIKLGRGPEGVRELMRAVEAKPDYWPPYAHISDYYKSLGNVDEARAILRQGLAATPDAKPLKRRLSELK